MGNQNRKATASEMSRLRRAIKDAFPELTPVLTLAVHVRDDRARRHGLAIVDERGHFPALHGADDLLIVRREVSGAKHLDVHHVAGSVEANLERADDLATPRGDS